MRVMPGSGPSHSSILGPERRCNVLYPAEFDHLDCVQMTLSDSRLIWSVTGAPGRRSLDPSD